MMNDLGISHDKLRIKHPLKASVTVDQTETDPSYRQEADVDLREPRIISGTSVLNIGK